MCDCDDKLWLLLNELSNVSCCKVACDVDRCKFCKSSNIVLEDGNYICLTCNTLLERFIDMQAEWRYYGADDNKSSDPTRCGMPVNELLPDSSLGSVISNQLNESYDMKLIKKYHMWNSITYKERSLYNIFENITVNAINGGSFALDVAKKESTLKENKRIIKWVLHKIF